MKPIATPLLPDEDSAMVFCGVCREIAVWWRLVALCLAWPPFECGLTHGGDRILSLVGAALDLAAAILERLLGWQCCRHAVDLAHFGAHVAVDIVDDDHVWRTIMFIE